VKVANAAIHLGMRVIGYDPSISVNRAWELSSQVMQAHHLDELLKASDYVSVHVPLIEETKNLLNMSRLQMMPAHAVLLNFARDGIVEKKALLELLNAKKLAAYVSDFPCELLQGHPAVISFPHLGASTREAEENCAVMLVKQVRSYLEYGAITYSANFPNVEVAPNYTGVRLAVVNANIPSMVAQISSKLAEARLNILSLMNKSREEIAYTLFDIDGKVAPETIKAISSIEGVLQVRAIGPCTNHP
jgi:D-3-phosphoglycerate dehydrogenase